MAEGKIEFQLGTLKFSGEGNEAWVTKQLEWLFEKLSNLKESGLLQAAMAESPADKPTNPTKTQQVGSLASHIKARGGDSNQVQRFLATADWLRLKGATTLKTSMIAKALLENHQKKLSNPADALNQNVSKGFCEKAADGFFVTPEGLKALGHPD